jgi:hypothetical protein
MVISFLINLEKSKHFPEKQRALMMSTIIEGFDLVIDNFSDKTQLLEFAERHVSSISPKTRKMARKFLSKYG